MLSGGRTLVELRELAVCDGSDVYEMVQEIAQEENGFVNSLYADNFKLFQEKLIRNYKCLKE
jgi:hypothetical protein